MNYAKFTPVRLNQLDVSSLIEESKAFQTPKRAVIDDLISVFWAKCDCNSGAELVRRSPSQRFEPNSLGGTKKREQKSCLGCD